MGYMRSRSAVERPSPIPLVRGYNIDLAVRGRERREQACFKEAG